MTTKKTVTCDICGEEIRCRYADAPFVLTMHYDPSDLVYRSDGNTQIRHFCSGCGHDVMYYWLKKREENHGSSNGSVSDR